MVNAKRCSWIERSSKIRCGPRIGPFARNELDVVDPNPLK
jgi:hypothetical protein